jgi:hypothetical protein
MAGKYKDDSLLLPTYSGNTKENESSQNINSSFNDKIKNPYNSSYVDGVFSYISSLLYQKGFVNAINFHGMFLGFHKNLKVNIIDDLEFLTESSYFHDNLNNLFDIENDDLFSIDSKQSGNNKRKVKIMDTIKQDILHNDLYRTTDNNKVTYLSDINAISELVDFQYKDDDIFHINNISDDASSTCSSASSLTHTSDDSQKEYTSDECDGDSNNSCETISDSSSEISYVEGIVHDFPVSIICMENCEHTLDYLMDESMRTNHWASCLMQVIVSLIVFQKKFNFTHNDLHTSNIMYVNTSKNYLCYQIDDIYYKVPTFGRIYKIIDFGRAIYNVNNLLIYSDAFNKKEDAATQYNFGPIYDTNKPEIAPNASFDLSRLACSLYDYFEEYEIKNKKDKNLVNLIKTWCTDDKGKNILYKSTGEERYPEFKLYKMISRTVHHCVPIEQLKNHLFSQYIVESDMAENTININSL